MTLNKLSGSTTEMLQMIIDVLHMFYNFQGHVLHVFYNFQNDSKNNLNIKDMAQMHLTPLSEVVDEVWGKTGTKERDMMEKQLKEDVKAYYLGEAIRKARKAQNLTQEQLGERIGVQRAQISRLEKGNSTITLPTLSRVFQALGIATATLDLGVAGKVALW